MRPPHLLLPILICAVLGISDPVEAGFFSIPTITFKGNSRLKKGRNTVKVVCKDDNGLKSITSKAPGKPRKTIFPNGARRQVILVRFRTSRRRAAVKVTVFNLSDTKAESRKIFRRT